MGTGGQKKDRQRDRGKDGTGGHREITTLNTHLPLTAVKTTSGRSRDHGLTNHRAHPNVVCPVCFGFFSSRHFWVSSVKQ